MSALFSWLDQQTEFFSACKQIPKTAQTQAPQPKVSLPVTLDNCKVTFDAKGHCHIEEGGRHLITLVLTTHQMDHLKQNLQQADWLGTYKGQDGSTVQNVMPPASQPVEPAAPYNAGMGGSPAA
jgi:hypothetical protein